MKKLFALLLILMSVIAVAEVDRSTPEKTIQSLASAFFAADIDSALACVKDSKNSDVIKKIVDQLKASGTKCTVVVSTVKINGLTATAVSAATLSQSGNSQTFTMTDEVNLVQEKGSWLIVAPQKSPDNQSFVNSIAYFLKNGMPKEVDSQKPNQAVTCLSHVKQVELAFLMLASDNDDLLKVKAWAWKKPIMPYLKDETSLTCPLDPKGTVSYSFNSALVGKNISTLAKPAQTVMVYEGKDGKLSFRHNKRAVVGFADGHVELVDAEKAKTLRWKP